MLFFKQRQRVANVPHFTSREEERDSINIALHLTLFQMAFEEQDFEPCKFHDTLLLMSNKLYSFLLPCCSRKQKCSMQYQSKYHRQLFPLHFCQYAHLALKTNAVKSHKLLSMFFYYAPSIPINPLPTEISTFEIFFKAIQLISQLNLLNFLFSARHSPWLDSRRICWGRKFWQGTLYPSINRKYANPWFLLMK